MLCFFSPALFRGNRAGPLHHRTAAILALENWYAFNIVTKRVRLITAMIGGKTLPDTALLSFATTFDIIRLLVFESLRLSQKCYKCDKNFIWVKFSSTDTTKFVLLELAWRLTVVVETHAVGNSNIVLSLCGERFFGDISLLKSCEAMLLIKGFENHDCIDNKTCKKIHPALFCVILRNEADLAPS